MLLRGIVPAATPAEEVFQSEATRIATELMMTQDISSFATEEDVTVAILAGAMECPGWAHFAAAAEKIKPTVIKGLIDIQESECGLCKGSGTFNVTGYTHVGFLKSMIALTRYRHYRLAQGQTIW